jgi:hypothetical protein
MRMSRMRFKPGGGGSSPEEEVRAQRRKFEPGRGGSNPEEEVRTLRRCEPG